MADTATRNSADGAMLSQTPTAIETAGGRFVDLLDPDPATIDLSDIARALAHTCRYGGHVKHFYSVAEHAALVHDLMRSQGADRDALASALLHDAAEAYLGDVVAPLKYALRSAETVRLYGPQAVGDSFTSNYRGIYDVLTGRMESAIAAAFGVDVESTEQLRVADMWALRIEAAKLTHSGGAHWRWPRELPNDGRLPDDVTWFGDMEPMLAAGTWTHRALKLGITHA